MKQEKKYLEGTRIEDLRGMKFGNLTVVEFDWDKYKHDNMRKKNGDIKIVNRAWICCCDCGNVVNGVLGGNLTSRPNYTCGCCDKDLYIKPIGKPRTESFYEKCIERGYDDILELWDYELNVISPKDISWGSEKSMYFKCPRGIHDSEKRPIYAFFKHDKHCFKCIKCNSFAQWGIDNVCDDFLDEYWDYDKNKNDPWEIGSGSNKKIYIKCKNVDYHESYETYGSWFKEGKRCPYCQKKKIHKLDSLAYSNPEIIDIWSEKNIKSPYEVAPKARNKYWFKCRDGIHTDYQKAIYTGKDGFYCPQCNVSKGESRVCEILHSNEVVYETQKQFDGLIGMSGNNLRYDVYIESANILIEYDGIQHFEPVDFNGFGKEFAKASFVKTKIHDDMKDKYAKDNNIKLIRIPYYDIENIDDILRNNNVIK